MYNPLTKFLDWYLSPVQGISETTAQTGLGVLPSRTEPTDASTDIVARLIESGHTPATGEDVLQEFTAVHDRHPSPFEELAVLDYVGSFGLLAN
ncbi:MULTISPECIES: hypothetical protein [Corynebacterium]|jgi:hypothetical protein|uniref:Uncharacterized protein n=1 Tax=Corynebacterium provencense TaxID=1737425 RepID=A0A2Z3YMI5_9CORY|nr:MULTISPECIES: hypothetical protein [Corynebacterium]AWT25362.1 hypothetical protein Csp1_05440 [Corynebacterium provencense]MCI1256252.1 hypothetical protein [Corynebacterium provencense]